jgi:hypothetical protein
MGTRVIQNFLKSSASKSLAAPLPDISINTLDKADAPKLLD